MAITVPCFTDEERAKATIFLAAQVAGMMGRKFEEGDWAKVYCYSKGIPDTGWSNLSIDIVYGNLGVEHKMICRRTDHSIKASCGETIMHPAGTRSIRIPNIEDATEAARDILSQYASLINGRASYVSISDRFNNLAITRDQAIAELMELFTIKKQSANNLLPEKPKPTTEHYSKRSPDMRTGWLLWQDSLREFLYFEEQTVIPKPSDYYAIWVDSGGGRRKKSRNLWVYHSETKQKCYSITTEAGAKIQPYFTVPAPDDKNLYHFVVQGEQLPNGLVRIWVTDVTASFLKHLLGSLETEAISKAISNTSRIVTESEDKSGSFPVLAVEILLTSESYSILKEKFPGVSDEHMIQQLLRAMKSTEEK